MTGSTGRERERESEPSIHKGKAILTDDLASSVAGRSDRKSGLAMGKLALGVVPG